jgi:hypothetical protein
MEEKMKMKKGYVYFILAAILSLAIAGTTYAFSFNFHGKMWQTVGVTDNYGAMAPNQKSGPTDYFSYNGSLNTQGMSSRLYNAFSENDDAIFGLTKARLRFEGTTDDGLVKIVYGLEVGTINWGDTNADKKFGLSGDGVNQETRFAYAEIAMPGIGGKVRAGLQPTKINHWVWTETAAGLTYHRNFGSLKTMAGWYRGEDKNYTSNTNRDSDYFVIKADNKFSKGTTLGFFGIFANLDEDDTSLGDEYDSDYYYLGLTGKYKQGKLFGNFDFIYQGGDIEFEDSAIEDLDKSAWLGNLTVGFKVTDNFKISANVLYVSGDDNPNDDDAENFDSIDVDVKVGIAVFKDTIMADCDRFISDAPYIMDKGLINYAIQAEYQISEKNNLRAAVRYLMTAEDLELKPNEKDDDLGYEFDLWYTYKLNKHVDLRIDATYLAAEDGADHLAKNDNYDSDNLYKLAAGIKISF